MRYTNKLIFYSFISGLFIGLSLGILIGLWYQSPYELQLVHPATVEQDIGEGLMSKNYFCILDTKACITPKRDGSGVVRVGWRPGRGK